MIEQGPEASIGAGASYALKSYESSNHNDKPGPVSSRSGFTDMGPPLPHVAMDFKVATAQYAMYLSFEDRARLFAELDYLLNPEGWEEDDDLPRKASYVNFLKWLVEARHLDWSSLGFDADGNLLCAYVGDGGTVTAAFLPSPNVHWTSDFSSDDGNEIAAGQSPLRSFVPTSLALLARIHGPIEHPR
ncbi:hypothetical protein ACIQUG_08110 [Ensifer sp. NPDC090286]|uniref:hypothetical protein n=1 Tax=Ensifer sp. NPDC090286 TaxID=3363991 RepID=UPI00383AC180